MLFCLCRLRAVGVLEECFRQIDVNHTGRVTYEELLNYMVTLSTVS